MSGPAFLGAATEVDPKLIGVIVTGALGAIASYIQGWRNRKDTKATKSAVETPNPAVTLILAELARQVQAIVASMATKDALNVFSASQDTFKSAVLLEIGQIREAGRALGEQFPQFKKELNEKVDGAVKELHGKIAAVEAKIPPLVDG